MELLLRELFIKDRIPHDWEGSEHNVIALVYYSLIQGLSTESREKSKPIQGHNIDIVLVEHIETKHCIPPVSLSSMIEEKRQEESESRDGIVR